MAKIAVVQRLAVAPDFRRRGFGSVLLNKATETALARDLLPVAVINQTEKESMLLFKENGWRPIGKYSGLKNKTMTSWATKISS